MCAYSFNCFYTQMYLYLAIQPLFLIWSLVVIHYCPVSFHPVFIHQAFQKHWLFNIFCVPLTFSPHVLRDRSGPPSVSYDKQLSDLTRYKPNTGELMLLEAGMHCFWLCVSKVSLQHWYTINELRRICIVTFDANCQVLINTVCSYSCFLLGSRANKDTLMISQHQL